MFKNSKQCHHVSCFVTSDVIIKSINIIMRLPETRQTFASHVISLVQISQTKLYFTERTLYVPAYVWGF
jgi:hypothetical protein